MKKLIVALCITFGFLSMSFAQAMDVTLTWDPNSEPDLAGYRLYNRTYDGSYDYTQPIWEGTENLVTVTVPDHSAFVVRAYDISGQESLDSNEATTWDGAPAAPTGCRTVD